jgi:DNA-binding transcriptional ArsR family regulator
MATRARRGPRRRTAGERRGAAGGGPRAGPSGDRCGANVVHLDKVNRVRRRIETPHALGWAAEVLKALADPTRLKLVRALMIEERLCVCDLAALAGVSASAVSHQLRLLRSCRLVRPEREGKMVYYRLDDEHVAGIVNLVLDHVEHE